MMLLLGAWGGAVHWRGHFEECQRRAAYHRGMKEAALGTDMEDLADPANRPMVDRFLRVRKRHAQMEQWYLRAAWRPWLPIPSDSTEQN